MKKVVLTDQAQDDLTKIDNSLRGAVIEKLGVLEQHPGIGGALKGDLAGCRKIVVRQMVRIVYREHEVSEVIAIDMRRDKEVYRSASARVRTSK